MPLRQTPEGKIYIMSKFICRNGTQAEDYQPFRPVEDQFVADMQAAGFDIYLDRTRWSYGYDGAYILIEPVEKEQAIQATDLRLRIEKYGSNQLLIFPVV